MAIEIKREKLFEKIENLKEIAELPTLYLSNYFDELRNDVDKEFAPKQLEYQNDEEKKKHLEEIWQQIISKIDSFEKHYTNTSFDLETNRTRINEIEKKLDNQEIKDPMEA